MNRTCAALRKDGKACQGQAGTDGFCLWHSPTQADKRAEARAKGGEHRANSYRAIEAMPPTLRIVTTYALKALDDVAKGRMDPRNAGAVASLGGLLIKAHEASVSEAQMTALEQRLAALEQLREDGPTLALVGRRGGQGP